MILGGSISTGHMVDSSKGEIWHQPLAGWLNHAFPCDATGGTGTGGHHVANRAVFAKGAKFVVANFHSVVASDPTMYDLIIMEFAVNDGHSIASHKIDNRDDGIAYCSEVLLRLLLQLPYRSMVLNLEMAWRFKDSDGSSAPFHKSAVLGHERMLQYYQITTVSTFHALFPIQLYDHIAADAHFNGSNGGTSAWFVDADGHKWAALTVAYAFHVEHSKLHNDPSEVSRFEFDAKGQLPPVWMITPQD